MLRHPGAVALIVCLVIAGCATSRGATVELRRVDFELEEGTATMTLPLDDPDCAPVVEAMQRLSVAPRGSGELLRGKDGDKAVACIGSASEDYIRDEAKVYSWGRILA